VEACGRVEVAAADHHAYFDACGPQFTKSLDAQAYVIPSWHVTHPAQAQLERLIGAWPRMGRATASLVWTARGKRGQRRLFVDPICTGDKRDPTLATKTNTSRGWGA